MNQAKHRHVILLGALSFLMAGAATGADVSSYSVLKGQFWIQSDATTLTLDPDLGFSILASVDLTRFYVVTNADLRVPGGTVQPMEDLADSWDYLDSRTSFADLNTDYPWGDYTVDFSAIHDGSFSCVVNFPPSDLPPKPQVVNFSDMTGVDPTKPLLVHWRYSTAPRPTDFVQVYIQLGHNTVFSTPDYGRTGALDGASTNVSIPARFLHPDQIYSLNLEVTRVISTNSVSYPSGKGIAAVLSSTEVDLPTALSPLLSVLGAPTNNLVQVQAVVDTGKLVVLQGSSGLGSWQNLATNTADSGTNVFVIPDPKAPAYFFRAVEP